MSIASVRTGLVNTLTACGPYKASEISTCDFGILAGVSACAIIITPTGESTMELATGGGNLNLVNDYPIWNFTGEVYLRYTGDSPTFLSKIWQAMDDIHVTFKKDRTLQKTVAFARVTKFLYNINEGYNMSGVDYGVVRFVVEAVDL